MPSETAGAQVADYIFDPANVSESARSERHAFAAGEAKLGNLEKALAIDYLFAVLFHAAGGVARVHDKFGVAGDCVVVIARMIGGDQDAIVAGKAFGREGDRAHVGKIVVAHLVQGGEVRDRCSREGRRER